MVPKATESQNQKGNYEEKTTDTGTDEMKIDRVGKKQTVKETALANSSVPKKTKNNKGIKTEKKIHKKRNAHVGRHTCASRELNGKERK